MSDVVAIGDGDWITAEIHGPRLLRKALREGGRPEDIWYDSDAHLWP